MFSDWTLKFDPLFGGGGLSALARGRASGTTFVVSVSLSNELLALYMYC
jgi:hypothetical protein